MLSFGTDPVTSFEMGGVKVEPLDVDSDVSTFDVSLDMAEVEGGLQASMEYSTELFERETVERWLESLEVLLEGIVEDAGRRIWELAVMREEEKKRLLEEWDGGGAGAGKAGRVQDLFEEQARKTPEAVAVEMGGQRYTYRQLEERSNRLSRYLKKRGIQRGERAGILLDRSLELPVALLGVLKAGGAYVPLDPGYPAARVESVLEDSGVTVVVTESRHAGLVAKGPWKTVRVDEESEEIGKERGEAEESGVGAEDLAYVIYTSGSTGRPKGVMVEHRSLWHHAGTIGRRYELTGKDRVLQFASVTFDVAAEEMYPTWASGGTVVMRGEDAIGVAELERQVEREGVTVLNLPAGFWHEWVGEMSRTGKTVPGSVRLVVAGSDRVMPEKLEWWRRHVDRRVRWMNGYGPTETTITATLYEPKEGETAGGGMCVPIGRPIPGVRVRVVDGHGGLAARGVGGELWIGGEGVARGYWAEEQKTAEKFVADPWGEAGERVYRTGDRVRYGSDGNLEFLGRLDGQVKVRGFRIEPGEIEAVLEQAAGVRESAVVARGEGGQTRLVAYVAPGAAGVTGSQLREHVKQRLPGYMVPAQIVVMGALPRTESGKVDRRRLPEPEESREAQEGYVAPQTPLEEKVAKIWSELLHREAVGVTDNFFDLGGHSLLATQVISRVREAFSLELPLRTLFEAPTVGQLALAIAQAQAQATSPEELLRMLEEIEKQEPGDPRPA